MTTATIRLILLPDRVVQKRRIRQIVLKVDGGILPVNRYGFGKWFVGFLADVRRRWWRRRRVIGVQLPLPTLVNDAKARYGTSKVLSTLFRYLRLTNEYLS